MANVFGYFKKKARLTLVLGATGKTGRRIVSRLEKKGVRMRLGSRSADPAFSWDDETNWPDVLRDVKVVYLNYAPDLAVPGAVPSVQRFTVQAKRAGVERVVLLSGRGEEEAQTCEKIVQQSGMGWTIVRASWFNQNFSESAFLDMVMAGQITLPAGEVPEPYIDVDDIADVIVAALTEARHVGEVYEVTGPRLMSMEDVASDLSSALGRQVTYVPISHEAFITGFEQSGAPEGMVWLMDYLFKTVLDGRNAHLCDGVQRALGRKPRDFADFAKATAQTGVWSREKEDA